MSAFGGKADIVADHEKKRDPRSGEINRAKPMEVDNNARLEKRTASRVFAVSPKKTGKPPNLFIIYLFRHFSPILT